MVHILHQIFFIWTLLELNYSTHVSYKKILVLKVEYQNIPVEVVDQL